MCGRPASKLFLGCLCCMIPPPIAATTSFRQAHGSGLPMFDQLSTFLSSHLC